MSSLHPTVWRTCRVLSSESRLKLLWKLFQEGEGSVTSLGKALGLPEPLASRYLRALNARGLISSQRRKKYVFYRPEANPEVEHAERMLTTLRNGYDRFMPLSLVAHQMTAFTHPRRIDIVRALNAGACDEAQLSIRTHISPQALYRHLKKLLGRGFIEKTGGEVRLRSQTDELAEVLLNIALG